MYSTNTLVWNVVRPAFYVFVSIALFVFIFL